MQLHYVHRDGRHTEVVIKVDYSLDSGVKEIISCDAINSITMNFIDITDFCMNKLDLDSKIDDITDWKALYHETLNERE